MTDPIQKGNAFSTAMQFASQVQGARKTAADTASPERLRKACSDFESIFMQQVLQQMRRTVPQDGLLNGGQAEQVYTSMLDGEMAKTFSEGRGLGLSEVLYRQLSTLHQVGEESDP